MLDFVKRKRKGSAQKAREAKSARRRDEHADRRRRGRWIIALVLVLFVLLASAVTWRRSHGIEQTYELSDLLRKRNQLTAERTRLQRLIRDESSRSRLMPTVQGFGMSVPGDAQVRILPR